jgi:hypothetical protein
MSTLHEQLLEIERMRREAFIDSCVERWNELWPETFWAKRIDKIKTDNNEENKEQDRVSS